MTNLTLSERERITDSVLKIQSVRTSLDLVDEDKIPSKEEIEACLESADLSLRTALGYAPSASPAKKDPLT
ncbi:MAG: hypothetical protein ABSF22_24905 [Bryobacteraceae bacterium]|jgi:hypothetical protein